jgi:hypothetical protein
LLSSRQLVYGLRSASGHQAALVRAITGGIASFRPAATLSTYADFAGVGLNFDNMLLAFCRRCISFIWHPTGLGQCQCCDLGMHDVIFCRYYRWFCMASAVVQRYRRHLGAWQDELASSAGQTVYEHPNGCRIDDSGHLPPVRQWSRFGGLEAARKALGGASVARQRSNQHYGMSTFMRRLLVIVRSAAPLFINARWLAGYHRAVNAFWHLPD